MGRVTYEFTFNQLVKFIEIYFCISMDESKYESLKSLLKELADKGCLSMK